MEENQEKNSNSNLVTVQETLAAVNAINNPDSASLESEVAQGKIEDAEAEENNEGVFDD